MTKASNNKVNGSAKHIKANIFGNNMSNEGERERESNTKHGFARY